ncbi:YqcC family protein [Haliea sp. E17]|uniref:YqcC family protein n=1 Tax=Haliea sp. E17 TaxID=3401576 RepID=UPI003AACCCA9
MRTQVAALLIDIEAQLRQLDMWEAEAPPAEAFASTQPFFIDTMSLPQWLQFVFLPTMRRLLDEDQPLPGQCGIAPMAEEHFRGSGLPVQKLIIVLDDIDRLLTQSTA